MYKPEQIVTLPRQIEVSIGNGKATPRACNEAGITVQTYYRWRKEYDGLKLEQAKLNRHFSAVCLPSEDAVLSATTNSA